MERVITTPRLYLRRLRAGDLDALHALYSDAVTMRYIATGEPATREQSAEALLIAMEDYEANGYGLLATVLEDTGEMIGRCGYKRWQIEGRDHLEIGWMIHRQFTGEGYATEAGIGLREHAFSAFGMTHVISVIQPNNLASIRVAEKVGETYWREWTTPGGQAVKVYRVNRRRA